MTCLDCGSGDGVRLTWKESATPGKWWLAQDCDRCGTGTTAVHRIRVADLLSPRVVAALKAMPARSPAQLLGAA